jgi:flavodoxin
MQFEISDDAFNLLFCICRNWRVVKMNAGIIIHSHTGNTLSAAERIREGLINAGHTVNLEQVKAVNGDPNSQGKVELSIIPDTLQYDVLIFGAPVWAFSLSKVMNEYLMQLNSLEGKQVYCFVTHQLPFAWMGGNHSVRQMESLCTQKGGKVVKKGTISWSSKKREDNIKALVAYFANI